MDTLIRTAYKTALQLPSGTSTKKLLALGVYNTFEELANATLIAQRERLNKTKQGRHLLQRLGYPLTPQYCEEKTQLLPNQIRENIIVDPIPKNMHPIHNQGRRAARARMLHKRCFRDPDVYYTDASPYPSSPRRETKYTITAVNQGNLVASASIRATCSAAAEAAAIALALRDAESKQRNARVLTDSQAACRLYLKGTLPIQAIRILGRSLEGTHGIVWCPGHEGLRGNEEADCAARGLTSRAADHTFSPRQTE